MYTNYDAIKVFAVVFLLIKEESNNYEYYSFIGQKKSQDYHLHAEELFQKYGPIVKEKFGSEVISIHF